VTSFIVIGSLYPIPSSQFLQKKKGEKLKIACVICFTLSHEFNSVGSTHRLHLHTLFAIAGSTNTSTTYYHRLLWIEFVSLFICCGCCLCPPTVRCFILRGMLAAAPECSVSLIVSSFLQECTWTSTSRIMYCDRSLFIVIWTTVHSIPWKQLNYKWLHESYGTIDHNFM
jgi:hypothetical protein